MTSVSEKGPRAVAASDEWSRSLDEMQYVEREGPCLDAARGSLAFRVPDMAQELRWPSYMPRAVPHGARSMVSLPLTTEGRTIGALNVYPEVIAGHASLASQISATLFGHRAVADQLRRAMASRAAIEQAKGS